MSNLLKNILILLGVTLVLGIVFMVVGGEEEQGGPVSATAKNEATMQTERILSDIQEINEYALDDTILEDPRFVGLTDYGITITDVPTGRNNPFNPAE